MMTAHSFNGASFLKAIEDVTDARLQLVKKHGIQSLPDGTDAAAYEFDALLAREVVESATEGGGLAWLDLLRERVEASAVEEAPYKLRAALVEVAALCVAWVQDIDHRTAGNS